MSNKPTAAQVLAARQAAGLTQTQAAALLYVTMRCWQKWEAGHSTMSPALWELLQLKLQV